MRGRRAGALIIAGMLGLTGCAVATDASWSPPEWETAAVVLDAAMPEPIDPASVGGLTGQRLRNDDIGAQLRFVTVPGATALNDRVLAAARDTVTAQAAATGRAYRPEAFPRGAGLGERGCVRGSTLLPAGEVIASPSLGPAAARGVALVCDVVAAAGPVLGVRLRTVAGGPDGVSADAASIVYTDVQTGTAGTAAELWTADAAGLLWTYVVEALRRDAGALSLTPADAPDEAALAGLRAALATTVPGAEGSLVFALPAGFTAPELAELGQDAAGEPRTVGVPAELATRLATPLGQALLAAGGAPFAAPAAGTAPVDCTLFPCVALTYDDGPSALTGGILDALDAGDAAGTFFVLGQNAAGWPDTVRRMAAEGHEVANHTWNHPHLPALDAAAVGRQIRDTNGAIRSAIGADPTLFRPPYGEYDAAVLQAAGMPAILWDVDTRDWQGVDDETLLGRVIDSPRPGSIVLQHDIHDNTARTVVAAVAGLRDRGFSLVTVTQLFGGTPGPGAWRSAR